LGAVDLGRRRLRPHYILTAEQPRTANPVVRAASYLPNGPLTINWNQNRLRALSEWGVARQQSRKTSLITCEAHFFLELANAKRPFAFKA